MTEPEPAHKRTKKKYAKKKETKPTKLLFQRIVTDRKLNKKNNNQG